MPAVCPIVLQHGPADREILRRQLLLGDRRAVHRDRFAVRPELRQDRLVRREGFHGDAGSNGRCRRISQLSVHLVGGVRVCGRRIQQDRVGAASRNHIGIQQPGGIDGCGVEIARMGGDAAAHVIADLAILIDEEMDRRDAIVCVERRPHRLQRKQVPLRVNTQLRLCQLPRWKDRCRTGHLPACKGVKEVVSRRARCADLRPVRVNGKDGVSARQIADRLGERGPSPDLAICLNGLRGDSESPDRYQVIR